MTHKSGSPSISSKPSTSYLDSKRRKSSGSSLNTVMAHERKRSDATQATTVRTVKPTADGAGNRPAVSHSSSVMHKFLRSKPSSASMRHADVWTADLDKDDLVAEEEMKKLGTRRKETELAAKTLDALRKRATPKERVSPQDAIRIAMLNIYERGEIIDYNDIYFCGTQNAQKVIGDLNSDVPNFGYDDERGDYTIITGDHLSYRYEIIDVLGKGSFGQVVRCIDHKTGALVAVKIIRNKKRFHQQALVEVNILQKLREWVGIPWAACEIVC
jgi:dual specificity tyrosine-phosphorylation-regulated kinase 2/3/4